MVDNGLLDYDVEEELFKTTKSGHRFLQMCGKGKV
ncbi:hypothetical protein [Candidatus Nitrososphaera gargensis]